MQLKVMGDLGDNHPPITHGPKGDFVGDFGGPYPPLRGVGSKSSPDHPGPESDSGAEASKRLQPRSNRHPVDELADVRAEMRRLKAREDELRDAILAGTCGLTGDQHEASVRATETERVDTAALRKELGLERLRPFLRKSVTQTVRVTEREVPEDL